MQKFFVLSRQTAESTIFESLHATISVFDPWSEQTALPKNMYRVGSLFLSFYDLDQQLPGMNYQLFTKEMAREIISFWQENTNRVDYFAINCEAGISRSAAIAAALCKIDTGDDEYFFKHYCPNRLVYKIILDSYYTPLDK
jgi:predicted protein tyrosine phosphatase